MKLASNCFKMQSVFVISACVYTCLFEFTFVLFVSWLLLLVMSCVHACMCARLDVCLSVCLSSYISNMNTTTG